LWSSALVSSQSEKRPSWLFFRWTGLDADYVFPAKVADQPASISVNDRNVSDIGGIHAFGNCLQMLVWMCNDRFFCLQKVVKLSSPRVALPPPLHHAWRIEYAKDTPIFVDHRKCRMDRIWIYEKARSVAQRHRRWNCLHASCHDVFDAGQSKRLHMIFA
jgi:hypothetical protein